MFLFHGRIHRIVDIVRGHDDAVEYLRVSRSRGGLPLMTLGCQAANLAHFSICVLTQVTSWKDPVGALIILLPQK